jgi:hypothetical protein
MTYIPLKLMGRGFMDQAIREIIDRMRGLIRPLRPCPAPVPVRVRRQPQASMAGEAARALDDAGAPGGSAPRLE